MTKRTHVDPIIHMPTSQFQKGLSLRTVLWLSIPIMCAYGVGFPSAIALPNGSSFLDIDTSAVKYSQSRGSAVAKHACRNFISRTNHNGSIISASEMALVTEEPDVCVIRGVIDPEIQYIAYLPKEWNGRFYMHGNYGFAGEDLTNEAGLAARVKALRYGFATAFTNGGHSAVAEPGASWGYNNLQREIDYAYRALHLTSETAKELISEYYGIAPKYSYFDGCSTGGMQGFNSSQRFPDDFDGILAGAPVFDMTNLIWKYWSDQKAIASSPLSRQKLELLASILYEKYDGVDAVVDGVISNPLALDFDVSRDLPTGGTDKQFSDGELETLEKIYSPLYVNDKRVYPGSVISGEKVGRTYVAESNAMGSPMSAWEGRAVVNKDGKLAQRAIVESWFRFLAFERDDPELDWSTLDPAIDLHRNQLAAQIFNASNPDLTEFYNRGGKMIVYHGWGDFGVNPVRTIEYYESVQEYMPQEIDQFLQLYLIPGMHHCHGGNGIDSFDLMTPLIAWVEKGVAPQKIIGYGFDDQHKPRSRPLCHFPKVEKYKGVGSIEHHSSFECVVPE
jgi:hypothetical protein